jgi:hypothetical protein
MNAIDVSIRITAAVVPKALGREHMNFGQSHTFWLFGFNCLLPAGRRCERLFFFFFYTLAANDRASLTNGEVNATP